MVLYVVKVLMVMDSPIHSIWEDVKDAIACAHEVIVQPDKLDFDLYEEIDMFSDFIGVEIQKIELGSSNRKIVWREIV